LNQNVISECYRVINCTVKQLINEGWVKPKPVASWHEG